MKYILSYGGGVNSSALFFYIIEKKLPLNLVIFSDTGEELKETYDTIEKLKQECNKRNIEFITVQSTYGKLYDYYYKNKTVMSIMMRDCTSKFKIAPIRQYIRKIFGKKEKFIMYIGISYDELHRMTTSNVKYIELSYPFINDKIDRKGNIEILNKYKFIASKSGCIGCPFQNKNKWINLYKTNPKEYNRWEKLEKNCSRYPDITINGNFRLENLRIALKEQTSLNDFSFNSEKDLLCPNTQGGCFL